MCAFMFSHWLAYDVSSLSFFMGMDGGEEDPISDYYHFIANKRAVRKYDPSIVVVGIDGCSRAEIADVIERIEFCQPKVIGLDVIFPYESSEGPLLMEAVSGCENIVLPVSLSYNYADDRFEESEANTFFYDSLDDGSFGAVNLVASDATSVVREFRPIFMTTDGGLDNFALKIASVADPSMADYVRERGNELETISYATVDFEIIEAEDVLSSMDLLRDKIVLVGTVKDYSDMHITPVEPRMPGVLIHAYTVAMILGGDFIKELPVWSNWLIAIVLCYLVVFLNLKLKSCQIRSIVVRLVQAIMLYAIVTTGCHLFIRCNVYLNLTFPVVMVGLGLVACDVCSGAYKLWNMCVDKIQSK